MNLSINPISTISNHQISFQQKYKIPAQETVKNALAQVVSKTGAAAVAAAALVIPANMASNSVEKQFPAMPTIDYLAEHIPEIWLDGELIFDPKNPENKVNFNKLKQKYCKETNKELKPFEEIKISGIRTDHEGIADAEIYPYRGMIHIHNRRGDTHYTIQYDCLDGLYSIESSRHISEKPYEAPLIKRMTARADGSVTIMYRQGFFFQSSKYIEYNPTDDGQIEIETYQKRHSCQSECYTERQEKEEWNNPDVISDNGMINYYWKYDTL